MIVDVVVITALAPGAVERFAGAHPSELLSASLYYDYMSDNLAGWLVSLTGHNVLIFNALR